MRGGISPFFVLVFLVAPHPAAAQDTGWTISSFHSDYTVRPDRSIDVVERIAVDFGRLQRHGIYREIPVRYRKVIREGLTIEGRVKVEGNVVTIDGAAPDAVLINPPDDR